MHGNRRVAGYVWLGMRERVGYGLGDLASNLSFGMVSLFLLYFYTDIYGLSAGEASLIFVIARCLDAVFTLLVGYFIDGTRSRHGKLRPYLLYGAAPLGVLTLSCFLAPAVELKFLFALLGYSGYCLAYSLVNTPYSALTNRMTLHEGARASLSMYRMLGAMLGYLLVSGCAMGLIARFRDPQLGYAVVAASFAGLATLLFLACFAMTRERVGSVAVGRPPLRDVLRATLGNAPLLLLSLHTAAVYVAYSLWGAMAVYYVNHVLGDPEFVGAFFLIQSCAYIGGTLLSDPLIRRIGKKRLSQAALLAGGSALTAQFAVEGGGAWVMLCVSVYSAALAMLFVCMWAMVADTVEYAQWRGAQRAEGAVYGFYNLVTKLAMAAAGGLAGLLLELHDYRPGEVSARALMGIERGMTLIPASCFALGLLAISFYALDESRYRQLLGQLLQRDPGR